MLYYYYSACRLSIQNSSLQIYINILLLHYFCHTVALDTGICKKRNSVQDLLVKVFIRTFDRREGWFAIF